MFLFLLLVAQYILILFLVGLLILSLIGAGPVDSQLLPMNNDITLYDLIFVLLDLFLVHSLDLVVSLEIGFLEMLELTLELFELSGDAFILCSEVLVLFLKRLVGTVVFLSEVSEFGVENTLLFLELFIIGVVFLSFFL